MLPIVDGMTLTQAATGAARERAGRRAATPETYLDVSRVLSEDASA